MKRLTSRRETFVTAKGIEFVVSTFTIAGTAPGPVLTIIAGQHGMEHSGPNLLPELIEELAGRDFAGTVRVCPCANPPALEIDYEFYPENEDIERIKDYYYSIFRHNYCPWGLGRDHGVTLYNMNRLWNHPDPPGVAGRIVRYLWRELCADANIIIDLHCLQAQKPLIFNAFTKNLPIIRYAGIEAVVMTDSAPDPKSYGDGNLSFRGSQAENRHAFCIEFSRQHGLKEQEYELGRQAIRNIMTGCGMLPGEVIPDRPVRVLPFHGAGCRFTVAHTGHIRYFFNLYDAVNKGDRVYEVRDIQTFEVLEEGFSDRDGILAGVSPYPVVRPGMKPCWIPEAELLVRPGQALPNLPADFFGKNAPRRTGTGAAGTPRRRTAADPATEPTGVLS